jgi:ankyrin repeat protein
VLLLRIVGDSTGAAVTVLIWLIVLGSLPVLYGRMRRWVWRRRLSRRNSKGETCLMTAARDGNISAVKDFLVRGAEVNDKDPGGQTALMRAAGSGHIAVVRLLLAHGAEVNEKDSEGLTALIRAEARGHREIVDFLKKSGATDSRTAPNAAPHPGP